MKHGYSPTPIDEIADAVIAAHPLPERAMEVRDEIIEAIRASDESGGRLSVQVEVLGGSAILNGIEAMQRAITIAGETWQLSPSMPGLHRRLPTDIHALDRLRSAIDEQHRRNGTRHPRADGIRRILDAQGYRNVYDVTDEASPVPVPANISHVTQGDIDYVARQIIRNAEGRWHDREAILQADMEVRDAVRLQLKGTICEIRDVVRKDVVFVGHTMVNYDVTVGDLSAVLRPSTSHLLVRHIIGGGIWEIPVRDAYVREQRLRLARMRTGQGDGDLLVDAVLSRRLSRIPNRAPVRRMLFAIAKGQDQRKTDWDDISGIKPDNGRIVARIRIARDTSWRNGELTIKNRMLPETVISALPGRSLTDVVDDVLLQGAVITGARNTKDGLVIRAQLEPHRYDDLWKRVGGD